MAQTPGDEGWVGIGPISANAPAVENALGAIFRLDGDLRFLYLNAAAARTLGVTAEVARGRTITELTAPSELYSRLETVAKRVVVSGEEEQLDLTVEAGSQSYFCRVIPEKTKEGATHVIGFAQDITELKRALAALGESNARMRSLLQAVPDMVARIGADGTLRELLPGQGFTPAADTAELLGKKLAEADIPGIATGVSDEAMRLIEATLRTGEVHTIEYAADIDGETVYHEARFAPYADDEVIAIVRDTSERKRAEKALEDSEARTRSLLRAMPDMVFRIDRDGRYVDFEPGIGIEPAVPPAAFLGRTVAEVITEELSPGLAQRVMDVLRAALDDGEVHSMEYQIRLPDGSADYEARLVRCAEGLAVVTVRDISDRKRAERALADSESRWRSLVENMPALVIVVDTEGKLLYVNHPVEPFTMEKVAKRSIYDFIDKRHEKQVKAIIARVVAGGPAEKFEVSGVGPNNTTTWYESHVAPLVTDGKVVGAIVISVDVGARRRLEAELQETREALDAKMDAVTAAGNHYGLSFREVTVLQLVADGKSDKEVAAVLGLRPRTVSKHVEKILKKMKCGSRTEAGVRAIRENLVS